VRCAEPNLNPAIRAALYAPTSGVINPYEACFALIENALHNGLRLCTESPVRAIHPADGHFQVYTDSDIYHTRCIVNAAGLYADEIAAMVGARTFAITPRKGEEYLLDKRLAGFVKHTIFPCPTPVSKGILIIPTFDGTLMVGPTASDTCKEDLSTTQMGAQEVFAAIKHLAPGISERDCIAEFAGVRAVSNTDDFIIEPTAQKGFINVAGIQSPGLTAAPAIACLVVDILRDEGLCLELNEAFVPTLPQHPHFNMLPLDEQMRLVQQDPRYSHVVCRCEQVYERDVLSAIERGARSLDGIKFRTRAGMGRCQGSFCAIRCMQLLADAAGIPFTQITKRGAGSWLVCQRGET
jgi:glycerol-3-phosphate dehydrogenase